MKLWQANLLRKNHSPLGFITLGCAFLLLTFSPASKSALQDKQEFLANYDIRTDKSILAKQTIAKFIEQSGASDSSVAKKRERITHAIDGIRSKITNLKIELNEDLRIPEIISPDYARSSNLLTPTDKKKRADVLREFLTENTQLVGLSETEINQLKVTADYTNPDGNLSFVHFEQRINDVPVFRGEVKAGFTRENEIIRVINNLAPNLDYESLSKDFGNVEQAVANASKFISSEPISGKTTAEKIYFPIDYGVARAAWRVLLWTKRDAFYVIVDAETGTLLWRKNLTESQTQPATYNVYGNTTSMMKTGDSPAPFTPGCNDPNNCPQPFIVSRQSFTLIGNEPPYNFNNLGWIPDGENRTIGNNAEAGIDRDATQGIDPNGWAFGSPNRNFVYTYNPTPGNPAPGEEPIPIPQTYPPSAFQQGSITNAFYAVNRWHDELYLLGFTEAARNFQNDNFGRGGLANDSISVEVQDGSGTNGANFSTPSDGGRPRLQLFVWTDTTPARDGALDNQVITHEVTHGLSNRLHGNASGLNSNMSRGMGEGWSDFYALALLSEPTDDIFGTYSIGCYSVAGVANCYYGFRRFPIARKASVGPNGLPHNPLTFANLNAGNCSTFNSAYPRGPIGTPQCDQVHNAGEIWSSALWEMRGQLIDKHGTAEGNRRALKYVTDGMKIAPLNPTMLQERDAILAATQVSDPNDLCYVWRGFAIRGFGFSASIQATSPAAVTEAFNLPLQCQRTPRADFDGDRKSDVSVFRPNEGNWYLNRSTNGFAAISWGISGDVPTPGDYDGDGKTDLAVFRANDNSANPDFYILNSSTFTFSGISWGSPADIPVIEDYDGDNKDDVAVYRSSSRTFYVLRSSNGSVLSFSRIPPQNFKPIAGDFDGDGKGDFTVFGNGQWLISKSSDNYNSALIDFWGLDTDKLVSADYDGDGKDDLAVFRPSDGVWYVRKSSGGNLIVQFGLSTDIPIPADYDGDGNADIAVYRNGTWWINRSSLGQSVVQFGLTSDIPIPNRYLP
jgi:hypothetical protein